MPTVIDTRGGSDALGHFVSLMSGRKARQESGRQADQADKTENRRISAAENESMTNDRRTRAADLLKQYGGSEQRMYTQNPKVFQEYLALQGMRPEAIRQRIQSMTEQPVNPRIFAEQAVMNAGLGGNSTDSNGGSNDAGGSISVSGPSIVNNATPYGGPQTSRGEAATGLLKTIPKHPDIIEMPKDAAVPMEGPFKVAVQGTTRFLTPAPDPYTETTSMTDETYATSGYAPEGTSVTKRMYNNVQKTVPEETTTARLMEIYPGKDTATVQQYNVALKAAADESGGKLTYEPPANPMNRGTLLQRVSADPYDPNAWGIYLMENISGYRNATADNGLWKTAYTNSKGDTMPLAQDNNTLAAKHLVLSYPGMAEYIAEKHGVEVGSEGWDKAVIMGEGRGGWTAGDAKVDQLVKDATLNFEAYDKRTKAMVEADKKAQVTERVKTAGAPPVYDSSAARSSIDAMVRLTGMTPSGARKQLETQPAAFVNKMNREITSQAEKYGRVIFNDANVKKLSKDPEYADYVKGLFDDWRRNDPETYALWFSDEMRTMSDINYQDSATALNRQKVQANDIAMTQAEDPRVLEAELDYKYAQTQMIMAEVSMMAIKQAAASLDLAQKPMMDKINNWFKAYEIAVENNTATPEMYQQLINMSQEFFGSFTESTEQLEDTQATSKWWQPWTWSNKPKYDFTSTPNTTTPAAGGGGIGTMDIAPDESAEINSLFN